jgi:hypothetical protein
VTIDLDPGVAILIGIWARERLTEYRRNGKVPPAGLLKLGNELQPVHVADMIRAEQNAERCRRYRARKRGESVPVRKPGPAKSAA